MHHWFRISPLKPFAKIGIIIDVAKLLRRKILNFNGCRRDNNLRNYGGTEVNDGRGRMEDGRGRMELRNYRFTETKMARDIPRHLIYCLLFLAAKVVSKCARNACIPMLCATHLCIELTFKGVFDAH